jgi:hypothetical protein
MNEIKPGKYHAKLKDYWIGKTSAGLPQAELTFEFEADGEVREMMWFGSFKEKARPHTIKALLHCGLQSNDLSALADGPDGGALEIGKEVAITIAKEIDDRGNPRLRINWINPIGGAAFRDKMHRAELGGALASLKGDVMAVRKETGIKGETESFQDFSADVNPKNQVGF